MFLPKAATFALHDPESDCFATGFCEARCSLRSGSESINHRSLSTLFIAGAIVNRYPPTYSRRSRCGSPSLRGRYRHRRDECHTVPLPLQLPPPPPAHRRRTGSPPTRMSRKQHVSRINQKTLSEAISAEGIEDIEPSGAPRSQLGVFLGGGGVKWSLSFSHS